jgi:hypothetical protein
LIARSDDDGANFQLVGVGSARLQSVRVSPSDAASVVAAGHVPGATPLATPTGVLFHSADAGLSFESLEIPLLEGELTVVISHLHPQDPGEVWVRTVTARAPESPPERLLRVRDVHGSGPAVDELLARRELRGTAPDPDHSGALWVLSEPDADSDSDSDPEGQGGLLYLNEEGSARVVEPTLDATCVRHDEEGLWLCPIPTLGQAAALIRADDPAPNGEPGPELALETVLRYAEIVLVDSCTDADAEAACTLDHDDLLRDSALLEVAPTEPAPSSGCAAGLGPGPGPGGLGLSLVALVSLALVSRRERRRPAERWLRAR